MKAFAILPPSFVLLRAKNIDTDQMIASRLQNAGFGKELLSGGRSCNSGAARLLFNYEKAGRLNSRDDTGYPLCKTRHRSI